MTTTSTEVHGSLCGVEVAWDALVEHSREPTPFLRSWWLGSITTPGSRFVTVHDGADLIGGAAFELDRKYGVRRCQVLGAGALGPHGLDAVALSGREDEVALRIQEWLRRASRVIDFLGIAPDGVLARRAPTFATSVLVDHAPYIRVPAVFDDYLATRSKKLRQEIGRVRRRLGERGLHHREVGPRDADRALETLLSLHLRRWGGDSLLLSRREALATALGRRSTRRGRLPGDRDRRSGRGVARRVRAVRPVYWYQMGRDPDVGWSNVGTLLKSCAVERSCRLGHSTIDLGNGAPESKRIWSDGEHPVPRLLWAWGPMPRLMTKLVALMNAARRGDG